MFGGRPFCPLAPRAVLPCVSLFLSTLSYFHAHLLAPRCSSGRSTPMPPWPCPSHALFCPHFSVSAQALGCNQTAAKVLAPRLSYSQTVYEDYACQPDPDASRLSYIIVTLQAAFNRLPSPTSVHSYPPLPSTFCFWRRSDTNPIPRVILALRAILIRP